MGHRPFLFLIVLLLAACASPTTTDGAPRLVQEATLGPITPIATRNLSATPSPTALVIPVSTSEIDSPLQVATIDVDFVLVTPTLPPSKTPTNTPTMTPTATQLPPPSLTPLPPLPTNVLIPTSIPAAATPIQSILNPQPQVQAQPQVSCSGQWFFSQPRPSTCPSGSSLTSTAALEQFQQGFMIWIGEQDAIYVIYDSANTPRWEVFNDTFEEGMIEYDPGWGPGPPYTYQPKRGFGKLWREHPEIRQRLGWSVREWSEPFTTQVQVGNDGSLFIQESRGGVFNLFPGGSDWKRYEGYGNY